MNQMWEMYYCETVHFVQYSSLGCGTSDFKFCFMSASAMTNSELYIDI